MRGVGFLLWLVFLPMTLALLENEWLGMSEISSCNNSTIFDAISEAVSKGRLSMAREIGRSAPPSCQRKVAKAYTDLADKLLLEDGYLESVKTSLLAKDSLPFAKRDDSTTCWNNVDPFFVAEKWDLCCSTLFEFADHQGECFSLDGMPLCCEMFSGSHSHLRLPALREISVTMRINLDSAATKTLSLEQDGYLRQFDASGVLWPAGYLLSLCMAAPIKCGIVELFRLLQDKIADKTGPLAIELGSGVGSSSIALALAMDSDNASDVPLIVATDHMPQSLALMVANIICHDVDRSITVRQLNHFNVTQVDGLVRSYFDETGGFSLVLGSSLQSFFDGTTVPSAPLWKTLDILLSSHDPGALALFAHTTAEPVHPPVDGSYRLIRRISGDVFQMRTRSSNSSDFEISVFQRSTRPADRHQQLDLAEL